MTLFKRMTAGRVVRTRQIRKREYRELLIDVEADLYKVETMLALVGGCEVVGVGEADAYTDVRIPDKLWIAISEQP